ncbi:MAG: acetyl-CoA C-acetyltransferase [Atopobiaceae bacterium]|nr:acetyl-CoA C-acetyltransferase [Atopobiaceae bacterium]
MRKVYILGACRTPIGKMGGSLSSLTTVDLGSVVIKEAVTRSGVPAVQIDHVYMGCVIQAGLGQNVARQAAIKAGLPNSTTAQTTNVVCGSGLDSVNAGARMIACGDAEAVVAGGMESMTNAPFAIMKGRYGYKMGSPMTNTPLVDTMVNDALWDAMNNYHMGLTAENVAAKYGLTRADLDEFAANSQNKASMAIAAGSFMDEIVPVVIEGRRGETVVGADEGPRPGTTVETLSKLKPVFKDGGMVTAGNSSGINDGAAAVVLVSEDKVRELDLHPQAVWLGGALGGVDPALMGVGPVVSTKKLLNKLSMTIDDFDIIEGNEAFAAQSLAVKRDLCISDEKLNVNGGAIALGHPVGASGCRILVTLIYALKQRNLKRGLAMLCIGGGMGCSAAVERVGI